MHKKLGVRDELFSEINAKVILPPPYKEDIPEDRYEEDNVESNITYSKGFDASWLKKGKRHIMYKAARNTPLKGFQRS